MLLHNSGFKKRKIYFSVKQSLLLIDPLLFIPFIHCHPLPSASILPASECRSPTDCCLSPTNSLFASLLPAFHLPITHLTMFTCQSSIVNLQTTSRLPDDHCCLEVHCHSTHRFVYMWLPPFWDNKQELQDHKPD